MLDVNDWSLLSAPGKVPFSISKSQLSTPIEVSTDQEGQFWLLIGTHSGFEDFSAIYYTRMQVTLTEVPKC